MKVLVFGMTENPGGIESVIMNYYRQIDRQKIQFDFLCNCKTIAYEDEIRALGGQIFSITPRKESFSAFRRELKHFMDTHAKNYDALWMNVCTLVNIDYLVAAKKAGIPRIIIHCHNPGDTFGTVKRLFHNYNRWRLPRYATDFWSCAEDASPWFYDELTITSDRYCVIPNAIDTARFVFNPETRAQMRKALDIEDALVVGHIGRFEEQKNHRFLIPVLKQLVKQQPSVRLLLIGQGPLEEEIRNLAEQEGLSAHLLFCGVNPHIERYYQAMDVFVMPSLFEGLSVAALEAQANGLFCIFSDNCTPATKVNSNVVFRSLNDINGWVNTIQDAYAQGRLPKKQNALIGSPLDMAVQVKDFEQRLLRSTSND